MTDYIPTTEEVRARYSADSPYTDSDMDKAYKQGCIDGEYAKEDSIIRLITNEIVFMQYGSTSWGGTKRENKIVIAALMKIIGKIKGFSSE